MPLDYIEYITEERDELNFELELAQERIEQLEAERNKYRSLYAGLQNAIMDLIEAARPYDDVIESSMY